MCKKFVPQMTDFFCITDDPSLVDPDIKIIPYKEHRLDPVVYNKLYMFSAECSEYLDNAECVYFDLDLIIRDNVGHALKRTGDLQIIDARWREHHPRGDMNHHHNFNSSCLQWRSGSLTSIWEYLMSDPEYFMSKYFWGMDAFLFYEHSNMNVKISHFQERTFYSFIYGVDIDLNIEHDPVAKGYRPSKLKHITDNIPVILFNGPATDDDYLKKLRSLNIINHALPHAFMRNDVSQC